jgi:hypothetical protein
LTGTIPSSLASLTGLTRLILMNNRLASTIPSSLALLTKLNYLALSDNKLTGLVPPLPFAQYTDGACVLDYPSCVEPDCNQFKRPLPVGSAHCTHDGAVYVHCK